MRYHSVCPAAATRGSSTGDGGRCGGSKGGEDADIGAGRLKTIGFLIVFSAWGGQHSGWVGRERKKKLFVLAAARFDRATSGL